MFQGKGIWRKYGTDLRIQALKDILELVNQSHISNKLFACVIDKSVCQVDPIEYSFEQVASRFDMYLKRLHRLERNTQRGDFRFRQVNLRINYTIIGY